MPLSNLAGLGSNLDQLYGLPPQPDPTQALSRDALGFEDAGLGEEFLAGAWRAGGPAPDQNTLLKLRLRQKEQRAPLTALEGELEGLGGEPTERFGDTLLRLGDKGLEAVGQDFTRAPMIEALNPAQMSRRTFAGLSPSRKIGEFVQGTPKALPQMTPEQSAQILERLTKAKGERDTKRQALTEDVTEARKLFAGGVRGQGLQTPRLKREAKEEADRVRREESALNFFREKSFQLGQRAAEEGWTDEQIKKGLKTLWGSLPPEDRAKIKGKYGVSELDAPLTADAPAPVKPTAAPGIPPLTIFDAGPPPQIPNLSALPAVQGRFPTGDPVGMLLNLLESLGG